jgi:hypothetical protein
MCGCPGQKGNPDFLAVINGSATFLAFEKPGKSGFVSKFARVYPNMGYDESLNVLLITSLAFERGCDAKPVNILIQFHMRGAFFAPSTPVNDPNGLFEYRYRHFQILKPLRGPAGLRNGADASAEFTRRGEKTPLRPQQLRAQQYFEFVSRKDRFPPKPKT